MSEFKPITEAELKRAYFFIDSDERFRDDICNANTLMEYEERQQALKEAEQAGLRNAINNVLKERAE